jgi:AGZA family xanthine/uracil permease-like MFS transporter
MRPSTPGHLVRDHQAAVGKAREVHPILYGVAVLFVLYFLRGPLESVLL